MKDRQAHPHSPKCKGYASGLEKAFESKVQRMQGLFSWRFSVPGCSASSQQREPGIACDCETVPER